MGTLNYLVISSCALVLALVSAICNIRPPKSHLDCHCRNQQYCEDYLDYDGCGKDGCETAWSGDFCQRLNMAHGLTGENDIGSLGYYGDSALPKYAVDGELSTFYSSNFVRQPYLWINTGEINIMNLMKISTAGIMTGVEIHVSNSSSFSNSHNCFNSRLTSAREEYNIKCTKPVIGQFVKVLLPRQTYLYIQEFEIYRCADYWFGDLCDQLCNCQNPTEICDKITGKCLSGCAPGYNGTHCQGLTSGGVTPLRLNGGSKTSNTFSGRLEVYYNGTWGTVCDDYFNNNAAIVVCRNLGYRAGEYQCCSKFGPGTGTIWLDDVVCNGSESDISVCQRNHWGKHNCGHGEDVGVICSYRQSTTERNPGGLANGDITPLRLVGGNVTSNTFSGRLEVFYNGSWGTVCDDRFNNNTARVLCRNFGYRNGTYRCRSPFGVGNGTIWLDDLICSGSEADIRDCRHNPWGVENCDHSEDVGLICSCPHVPIRTSEDTVPDVIRTRIGTTNPTTQTATSVSDVTENTTSMILPTAFHTNSAQTTREEDADTYMWLAIAFGVLSFILIVLLVTSVILVRKYRPVHLAEIKGQSETYQMRVPPPATEPIYANL